MTVQDLIYYSEEMSLYPMTLERFAASEAFYKLYKFPECKLTFIYNTVTCSVAIYNGKETDSLIIEVHNINGLRYLERTVHNLVRFIFDKHQEY